MAEMQMADVLYRVFDLIWLFWLVLWLAWAGFSGRAARREPLAASLSHRLPVLLAALLLFSPRAPFGLLGGAFLPGWPLGAVLFGLVLTLAGLGFSVWARAVLGGNWSSDVEIKQAHVLVARGPYALIRHPIYTGLLTAFFGSFIALGEWRGLLALALATLGFWIKLGREERWMALKFGDAYQDYRARTFALVPYLL